jgi:capsular polysaccharide biosynthesis protein
MESIPSVALPFVQSLFWESLLPEQESAWHGLVPVGHWIVQAIRPRVVVELGTHNGVSYAAFCNSIKLGQIAARCYAVDTWEGDPQAGFYSNRVYEDLRRFNDTHFSGFSTLLRMTFHDALQHIEDQSVDLLHIDGLHTYDAVSEDFRTWQPKLSERGVVIFHDTDVHKPGFGVWRFWNEIREAYPSFRFSHSHGLGILAVGNDVSQSIASICGFSDEMQIDQVRAIFEAASAAAWAGPQRLASKSIELANRSAEVEALKLETKRSTARLRDELIKHQTDANALRELVLRTSGIAQQSIANHNRYNTLIQARSHAEPGELMTLHHCGSVSGEVILFAGKLNVCTHEDALLEHWSLYDGSRRMIVDSGYFRGLSRLASVGGPMFAEHQPMRVADVLPDDNYFWLGPCHQHFGHFLISTLGRLWALDQGSAQQYKFLYTGGLSAEKIYEHDFMREIFNALGIEISRMVHVTGPVRIPRVTIAATSFTENNSVHSSYIDLLKRIAGRLDIHPNSSSKSTGSVYVSKQKVSRGVRTVVNEADLTKLLIKRGLEVVCPETLPFQDQLRFWAKNRNYIGFSGSSFHMAGFFPGKNLCTISHDKFASSNQALIDVACGNNHLYLHGGPDIVQLGQTEHFSDALAIVSPELMANDIMSVIEGFETSSCPRGQHFSAEPRSADTRAIIDETFGFNLARTGIASQSSVYEINENWSRTADGLINGKLTGHYQCHTQSELYPWWQIDLKQPSLVFEVRVFNRCDQVIVQERLLGFRILVSGDGSSWTEAYQHDGSGSIGGLIGTPFRWLSETDLVTRFVRIQLSTSTFLHLDQVEVFGVTV